MRTYSRQARSPFNLTGHPAIALMCGLSSAGLPLSVQLVGRPCDEVTLLRTARAYERAAPWHEKMPPMEPSDAARSGQEKAVRLTQSTSGSA